MINLDQLSSTSCRPEVIESMLPFLSECPHSAQSLHRGSIRVRKALQSARESIASLIGATHLDEILFTSGGTEAANWAISRIPPRDPEQTTLLLSNAEHPALQQTAHHLPDARVLEIPVDSEGRIGLSLLREALDRSVRIAAFHLANHDLGTLQPVEEIGALTQSQSVPLFLDGSTAGGWIPIDVRQLSVDLLSLSPHRFGGPKGVGVLYRKRGTPLNPILRGGKQEWGLRAGTENIPAIVGAGVAAQIAGKEMSGRISRLRSLQQQLCAGLLSSIPGTRLLGSSLGEGRLPHHLHLLFDGISGEELALVCDLQGLAVGAGTSCATGAQRVSHALRAIGLSEQQALSTLLLGIGETTTAQDIDLSVKTITKAAQKIRALSTTPA